MPEISRFFGIVIRMHLRDHAPPHFHVESAEWRASFQIASCRLQAGALPRRMVRLVTRWASLHREELLANWARLRQRLPTRRIPPLE